VILPRFAEYGIHVAFVFAKIKCSLLIFAELYLCCSNQVLPLVTLSISPKFPHPPKPQPKGQSPKDKNAPNLWGWVCCHLQQLRNCSMNLKMSLTATQSLNNNNKMCWECKIWAFNIRNVSRRRHASLKHGQNGRTQLALFF
jgi:hypothetical protein